MNAEGFGGIALANMSDDARAALERGMRAVAREECQRPEFVSQRTAERVLSLPRGVFLAAHRANAFPTSKIGRLVLARTDDVIEWVESQRTRRPAEDAANDTDWSDSLARAGARRIGDGR